MVYQNYNIAENINNKFIAYVGGIRSPSGAADGLNEGHSFNSYINPTHIWQKPKGSKFIYMLGIGAGTGGGGGAASPSGFAAGGGAGGSPGSPLNVFMPSFMVPNILYVTPGNGGAGGKGGILGASGSNVSVSGGRGLWGSLGSVGIFPSYNKTSVQGGSDPDLQAQNVLLHAWGDTVTGKSEGGTSSTGGTGAGFGGAYGSESYQTQSGYCYNGFVCHYIARTAGANGSITSNAQHYQGNLKLFKMGAGGGGASSVAYTGGRIFSTVTVNYYGVSADTYPATPSGQDGGGGYYGAGSVLNGSDRIFNNYLPFFGFGGVNGGGGNIDGNGGNGGNGGLGGGGGGGGGAIGINVSSVKGGDGGDGGPGAFLFWSVN